MIGEPEKQNAVLDESCVVQIVYTNYKGETAIRQILPQRMWYGATEWHPEKQWLLDAIDVEKNALRAFAMKDIRAWF
jgi:predicted DNA-binding transcriptional regulator YafY